MRFVKVKGGIRLVSKCHEMSCYMCSHKDAICFNDKLTIKSRVIKPLNKTGIVPAKGGKHGKS
jgi:hypothetical protein